MSNTGVFAPPHGVVFAPHLGGAKKNFPPYIYLTPPTFQILEISLMETSGSWVRPWLQAGVFATHFFDPQRCSQTGRGVGLAPSTGYIMYLAVYPSNHGKTSTKKISPVRDWRSTSFECIGVGGGGAGEAFASPSPNFGQQIFFRQDVNAEFTFFTYSY